jgi:ferredoxin
MALKVEIDKDRCIGSGNCVFLLPEVFALDENDKSMVLDARRAPVDRVLEVAGSCPTQAIMTRLLPSAKTRGKEPRKSSPSDKRARKRN